MWEICYYSMFALFVYDHFKGVLSEKYKTNYQYWIVILLFIIYYEIKK